MVVASSQLLELSFISEGSRLWRRDQTKWEALVALESSSALFLGSISVECLSSASSELYQCSAIGLL